MAPIYHHFKFSDPEPGSTVPNHVFSDRLMAEHGVPRMPALFHNHIFADDDPGGLGPIDEDKFRYRLTHGNAILDGGRCWLDIEGAVHRLCRPIQEPPWFECPPEELDFFHHVLTVAQKERPKVKFGLYGQIPSTGWGFTLNPNLEEVREQILVACHPLAKRLGFLLPYFYDEARRNYDTFDYRLQWIRKTLVDCKRFFPETPVIGMLWPEDYGLWRQRPTPDTAEHQKLRQLSGLKWLKYNEIVRELADGVLWWCERKPWDPTADWWWVTQQLIRRVAPGQTASKKVTR